MLVTQYPRPFHRKGCCCRQLNMPSDADRVSFRMVRTDFFALSKSSCVMHFLMSRSAMIPASEQMDLISAGLQRKSVMKGCLSAFHVSHLLTSSPRGPAADSRTRSPDPGSFPLCGPQTRPSFPARHTQRTDKKEEKSR